MISRSSRSVSRPHARRRRDAQRERMFAEILVLAADCEAAQRALSQIPPQPPSQVEAHLVDGAVQLHWAPPPRPGVSSYLVFRARASARRATRATATLWAGQRPAPPRSIRRLMPG